MNVSRLECSGYFLQASASIQGGRGNIWIDLDRMIIQGNPLFVSGSSQNVLFNEKVLHAKDYIPGGLIIWRFWAKCPVDAVTLESCRVIVRE